MGQLFDGSVLNWEDIQKWTKHVHTVGTTQFINHWNREKNRSGDPPLWGDEVCPRRFAKALSKLLTAAFDRSSTC
jgi:hypothetical protein